MKCKGFELSIIQDTEGYININKIAELKGLKSNRSLRIAIQKGKYVARKIQKPDEAAGRMPESGIQGLVHPNNPRQKLEDESLVRLIISLKNIQIS